MTIVVDGIFFRPDTENCFNGVSETELYVGCIIINTMLKHEQSFIDDICEFYSLVNNENRLSEYIAIDSKPPQRSLGIRATYDDRFELYEIFNESHEYPPNCSHISEHLEFVEKRKRWCNLGYLCWDTHADGRIDYELLSEEARNNTLYRRLDVIY